MAKEVRGDQIDLATIQRTMIDNRVEIVKATGEVVALPREQNRLLEKIYRKLR